MKKVAILQSNYIPWKGYFDIIRKVDEFVFLDDVQYTKNDWRNRNLIKTKDGLKWLTIPVNHGNLSQKSRDKKVTSKRWAKKHCNALEINYSSSKWFKDYKDVIFDLYDRTRNMNYLVEINHTFIQELCKLLGIETPLLSEPHYPPGKDKNANIISMCNELKASHYLTGPAAKNYLDEEQFNKAGITVEWMDYKVYPEYEQLHPPFEHEVTVLDWLFNSGDMAKNFFKQDQ